MALEDENGIVVQRPMDDSADAQLWVIAKGDSVRHYTLKNFATGRYYCPPKALLDTVKTSETACDIRIENASVSKGYYVYGDYDSDFVGDVLNISKDAGMPVITWVRTGTDNQKFQFKAAKLPELVVESSSSSEIAPGSSDSGISSSSGTDAIVPRTVRSDNTMSPARKGYRDLKGRHYEKQIRYRVMF
jgi:hypothetical protein